MEHSRLECKEALNKFSKLKLDISVTNNFYAKEVWVTKNIMKARPLPQGWNMRPKRIINEGISRVETERIVTEYADKKRSAWYGHVQRA